MEVLLHDPTLTFPHYVPTTPTSTTTRMIFLVFLVCTFNYFSCRTYIPGISTVVIFLAHGRWIGFRLD